MPQNNPKQKTIKFKGENSTWQMINIDKDTKICTLSGPGPCRSVRYETEEFILKNTEIYITENTCSDDT